MLAVGLNRELPPDESRPLWLLNEHIYCLGIGRNMSTSDLTGRLC